MPYKNSFKTKSDRGSNSSYTEMTVTDYYEKKYTFKLCRSCEEPMPERQCMACKSFVCSDCAKLVDANGSLIEPGQQAAGIYCVECLPGCEL